MPPTKYLIVILVLLALAALLVLLLLRGGRRDDRPAHVAAHGAAGAGADAPMAAPEALPPPADTWTAAEATLDPATGPPLGDWSPATTSSAQTTSAGGDLAGREAVESVEAVAEEPFATEPEAAEPEGIEPVAAAAEHPVPEESGAEETGHAETGHAETDTAEVSDVPAAPAPVVERLPWMREPEPIVDAHPADADDAVVAEDEPAAEPAAEPVVDVEPTAEAPDGFATAEEVWPEEPEVAVHAEPEPEAQPEPEPEAWAQPEAEAQPEPEPESEPAAQPEKESEVGWVGRRTSEFWEVHDGGYGMGSAAPIQDGAIPLGHEIQAYHDTMTYRAPGMPGYDSVEPDVWFYNVEVAEQCGFTRSESSE